MNIQDVAAEHERRKTFAERAIVTVWVVMMIASFAAALVSLMGWVNEGSPRSILAVVILVLWMGLISGFAFLSGKGK